MPELDPWHYLIVMGGCLAITAPLEFAGARVYRRPLRVVRSIAPVVAVFLTWDAIAIAAEVWWFNPRFITGFMPVLGIPVEEVVFFLVIPLCALLTYDTVDRLFQRERRGLARGAQGAKR